MEPVRINKGLQRPEIDLSRYQKPKQGHLEKGRKPINEREEILTLVAKLTNTPIPRWCRYSPEMLKRAYIAFGEINHDGHIKKPAAYFIFLLKTYKNEEKARTATN